MVEPIDPRVVELNSRIFAWRLKLREVLNRAGVPPSTWYRWVHGTEPRRSTVAKIDSAIIAKINELENPHGSPSRQEQIPSAD